MDLIKIKSGDKLLLIKCFLHENYIFLPDIYIYIYLINFYMVQTSANFSNLHIIKCVFANVHTIKKNKK